MTRHNVSDKAVAHLEMVRPYTLFHSGLVAVAGTELGSSGHAAAWRVLLAALVTICGWEAGLYAGDYYDQEIDARSKPSRPVPSGRVSAREAFCTMIGLIVTGYIGALILSPANFGLAVITTVLGITYSKTFKGRALLGNFDRGLLGVCAVLFGALAGGNMLAPGIPWLAALVFCHDSATNLVGAIRDVDGDRVADCPTVPVVYGVPRAVIIACALALAWIIIGTGLFWSLLPNPLAVALFILALALALWVYVPMFLMRDEMTRAIALRAHKYLVVERLVVMSSFIAIFVPPAVVLGLLAATVLATVGSQWILRDRYERQVLSPAVGHS